MTTKRYSLEIYEPGSVDDVCVSFQSDTPFGAIAKGDILARGGWPEPASSMDKAMRVTQVEHILWEVNEGPKHKVCVFTEEIPNSRRARGGKYD